MICSEAVFEIMNSAENYSFDLKQTEFNDEPLKYYQVSAVDVDIESILNITKTRVEDLQVHFVIIPKTLGLRKEAIGLAEWLRSSGFKVILDLNPEPKLRKQRIKENKVSNSYGIILLETPKKLKLIESRSGVKKEFSNLEELLGGGD